MSWGLFSRRLLGALAALTGLLAPATAAARTGGSTARAGGARSIAIELPLRIDATGLDRFATAVSTPGSPRYGDYASVGTLARRFGASPAARAHVTHWLRAHGATHVSIDPTGLFANATLRASTAERLFATRLARVHADATRAMPAHTFVAPAHRARVPAALRSAVTGVVGLSTRPLGTVAPQHASANAVTALHSHAATATSSAYPSRTGTPAGCSAAVAQTGFTPNEYLTAYGYDQLHEQGLEGQGERVALIEIDGFKLADVKAFASCFHLTTPKINAYGVGIKTALPAGAEATLDLELLDTAAPDVQSVDVYESEPVAAQVLRSLTAPLSVKGRKPDVISASLGTCQPDARAAIGQAGIETVEQALELAAATGISVLASAGDDGSTACLNSRGSPLDQLAVDYPAASPWVTGVGGTNVHLSAANAIADPATGQVVWDDEPAGLGAGGGGTSTFPKPSYQQGFQHSKRREVPDVSMLADPLPGYEIYCTATSDCAKSKGASPWETLGGTSAGTPLLAGGFALIDQELRGRDQQNIGFANPLLYKIAHSSAAALTLSDVTTGSNDLSKVVFGRPLGCCSASTGYDSASGLGSVNLTGLATAAATLVPRRVKVSLSLPAQSHPANAGRLLAKVACSGQCLMGAYARIKLGSGGLITVYSHPYRLVQRRSRTVTLGLSAANLRRIRTALADHRTVTAKVYGALIDAGGKVVRQTAPRTLHIRG